MIDLLIKNIRVLDPINGLDKYCSIACDKGLVVEISEDCISLDAKQIVDYAQDFDAVAISGLIDSHVHLGSMWGGFLGQKMLVKAGITTCLDMAGPIDDVIGAMHTYGAGMNVATLQLACPPFTFENSTPSEQEIEKLVQESLKNGALGVKILGGHYPLTPDACSLLIKKISDNDAYVAWHAGSTENGSNILGMMEAVDAADGNFLHLAHINSYCRGTVKTDIEETLQAIEKLEAHPEIFCESYISPNNGTKLTCVDSKPESNVTKGSLLKMGLEASEKGIEDGLKKGIINVIIVDNEGSSLLKGEKALQMWKDAKTDIGGSFPVNPATPRSVLAAARRKNGEFVVDCLSTDGGNIPRNVLLSHGLSYVDAQILSMDEFIIKTSYNPAKLLRLHNKGQLSVGKDADITIIDTKNKNALTTIANGKVIMHKGLIIGEKSTVICTEKGEKYIKDMGLDAIVVNPAEKIVREAR